MELESKYNQFHSGKCIWKCRLQTGGHLVQASLSQWAREFPNTFICLSPKYQSGHLNKDGFMRWLWSGFWDNTVRADALVSPRWILWNPIDLNHRHSTVFQARESVSKFSHWPFMRGIHRWAAVTPHRGLAFIPFDQTCFYVSVCETTSARRLLPMLISEVRCHVQ